MMIMMIMMMIIMMMMIMMMTKLDRMLSLGPQLLADLPAAYMERFEFLAIAKVDNFRHVIVTVRESRGQVKSSVKMIT